MDDVERLRVSRKMPLELEPFAQQCLLNLMVSGEEGSVEIWIKATPDSEPTNYGQILLDRATMINESYDKAIVKLGYPEGTGRFV